LFNLQATTTIAAYGTMSYASAHRDADGDLWLCCGLEFSSGGDADVFVQRWRTRRATTALQLSKASNQYLTRADDAAWAAAGGFTAAGWIYRDSNGTAYFAGKYAAAGTREWAIYSGSSNFLTARLSADGTNATVFSSVHSVAATGQWRFIALRYDLGAGGAELSLDLDDAKDSMPHAGGIFHAAADVRLGASDISLADSHDGRMDRWGFWNRALTDAEIAELRNAGRGREFRELSDALKADLIAYYDLGQYSGSRADASGNGQHLTPVNDPANADGVVE
jgi:hypothetical protein